MEKVSLVVKGEVDTPETVTIVPKRRSQKRGLARRQEIVKAAVEEFSTHGFRGRGLRQLAARIGLSEAGLFHHFGKKSDLLDAVLRERHASTALLFREVTEQPGQDGLKALPDAFASILKQPELAKFAFVLMAESLEQDAPSHDYYLRYRERGRTYLTQKVRDGIDAGQFRNDVDPDTTALVIQAVLDGLQGLWFLNPDQIDTQATMELFTDMMLSYLAKPTATSNKAR